MLVDFLSRTKYIRRLDLQPVSGACRTTHDQRVRRGERQTSLGEWDVHETELDPGESFVE
jgi:hypothetical protein